MKDDAELASQVSTQIRPYPPGPAVPPADDAAWHVAEISSMLHSLDEAAAEGGQSSTRFADSVHESKLVQARLGIAGGLFAALRAKHPPTASHSLRVALGCSSWAADLELGEEAQDVLEVAALLHDVGKIGVPDSVLLKPGRLLPEEIALMERHASLSIDILTSCRAPAAVLEAVQYCRWWYGGPNGRQDRHGENLPLAARMLSIVDAFDSMTTDHVYRPARSRERALAELFEYAGTQFDPVLVRRFNELFAQDQNLLSEKLARRWLHHLSAQGDPLPWNAAVSPQRAPAAAEPSVVQFERKLIDNMRDGVVFVDGQSTIVMWNTGVERLTGVSSQAACGRTFLPELVELRNAKQQRVSNGDCPVAHAIATGVQWLGRASIMGRHGRLVAVDLHVVPVQLSDGSMHGATVLLHDVSSETSLEEKCQALHAQVAKDPLTQVANRAEFDRMLNSFVAAHQEANLPCSLIMCDIDHFKAINDTFGHQAGDEAIISFTSLLKSICRSGDLVARYGGEEFAILCADCSNAATVRKAEQIRKSLAELTHSSLGNRSITASFGVTVLQAGDTPETMLRRADRALLMAKDQGRNQVVQLGDGKMEDKAKKCWWPFQLWRGGSLVETTLVTSVPIEVAIQKLRGFIADQNAKIIATGKEELELEVCDRRSTDHRRSGDRSMTFVIRLKLSQKHFDRANSQGMAAGSYVETRIETTICPRRERDRRREASVEKARRLLGSLKSYLMAHDATGQPTHSTEPQSAAAD
jgi:diguanylate cyclase (GGDEF)-like protein/PAS domain S-box-containing protein